MIATAASAGVVTLLLRPWMMTGAPLEKVAKASSSNISSRQLSVAQLSYTKAENISTSRKQHE